MTEHEPRAESQQSHQPSAAHEAAMPAAPAVPAPAAAGPGQLARARTLRWPAGMALALGSAVLASMTLYPSYIGYWLAGSWFSVPHFGWLAWLAFVPVLVAVAAAPRARGAFVRGFLFAAAWFLLSCAFIVQVHWAGWLAGALGFGVFAGLMAVVVWGIAFAGGRVALVAWPLAWVGGDWLIATVGVKFPWLYAAYSQLDINPWIVQTADLFGVYGTSLLVLAVNAAVAVLLLERGRMLPLAPASSPPVDADADAAAAVAVAGPAPAPQPPAWRALARRYRTHAVGLLLVLLAAHVYGAVRLATLSVEPGPTVALLQNNVPIGLQRDRPHWYLIVERMLELIDAVEASPEPGTRRLPAVALREWRERYPFVRDELVVTRTVPRHAASGRPPVDVDLVVFPENFPLRHRAYELSREPGFEPTEADRQYQRLIDRLARLEAHGLLNSIELTVDPRGRVEPGETLDYEAYMNLVAQHRAANTATLLAPGGTLLGRYVKMELVPVGEYVPLREVTSLTRELTELTIGKNAPDYAFGVRPVVFEIPVRTAAAGGEETVRFATPICFESNFPALLRSFVRAGADMLIIQSDDGWFVPSNEPEQVWLGARFRAIESRVSVARAVSSGHTGVVGPDGEFRARLVGEYDGERRTWGFPGALIAEVPRGPAWSVYLVVGDVLPVAGLVLAALALGLARRRATAARNGRAS